MEELKAIANLSLSPTRRGSCSEWEPVQRTGRPNRGRGRISAEDCAQTGGCEKVVGPCRWFRDGTSCS